MNQAVPERQEQDIATIKKVGESLLELSGMPNVTLQDPTSRFSELRYVGITGSYQLAFLFTGSGEVVAWQLEREFKNSIPSVRIGAIESFGNEVGTAMQEVWYEAHVLDPLRPYEGKEEDAYAMKMAGLAAISICRSPQITLCMEDGVLSGFEMVEKSAASEAPEMPFYDFRFCYTDGHPTGWRLNMHYRGHKLTRMGRSDLFSEEIAGAVRALWREFSLLDRLVA